MLEFMREIIDDSAKIVSKRCYIDNDLPVLIHRVVNKLDGTS